MATLTETLGTQRNRWIVDCRAGPSNSILLRGGDNLIHCGERRKETKTLSARLIKPLQVARPSRAGPAVAHPTRNVHTKCVSSSLAKSNFSPPPFPSVPLCRPVLRLCFKRRAACHERKHGREQPRERVTFSGVAR